MNCMKCGVEIEAGQAFCPDCLADMENYPVRPNVIVRLPQRRSEPVRKPSPRRVAPNKTLQIATLRKRLRIVSMLLALAVLLLAVITAVTIRLAMDRTRPQVGQNYSAVTTPTEQPTDVSRETSQSETGR